MATKTKVKGKHGIAEAKLADGPVKAVIHASTPPAFREILEEENEAKLLTRQLKASSYPEYVIVMHRLAQLRETHAVSGILSSSAYNDAKAAYDAAKVALDDAEKALRDADGDESDEKVEKKVEQERELITRGVLGHEWRYTLALEAATTHPAYLAVSTAVKKAEKKVASETRATAKRLAELDRELKKAIIRFGPAAPKVLELRKQLREMEKLVASADEPVVSASEAELAIERAKVLKQLLGNEKTEKNGERYFDGTGEIDLEPIYRAHLARYALDIEMQIMERRTALRHNGEQRHLLLAVEAAKQNLRDVSHDLDVHNAALERAKRRSEAARKRVVRFEHQKIDENFAKTLDARRGHLVAVFVEESLYLDNIIYAFRSRAESKAWVAFADVAYGASEDKMMEILLAQKNVSITEQKVKAPDYKSWATLQSTTRITVDLGDGARIHYSPHKSFKFKGKMQVQAGPYSERGNLRVVGLKPAEAMKALETVGLHKRLCRDVPYDLIYRGTHRYGRIHPQYEPLASGRSALQIPDGHMVIHGLTGAGGSDQAIKRLEMIVDTGGLKSIAERRRMDIQVQTMSPVGDIASGIDMGVPTKIGDSTTYGGSIFFVMKPEILNRRDLWFSDRDFGGGHNRYSEYQAYAKKIGQSHIYDPCPVDARQKHLDNGLGNTNEAYFRHEISWNEVDTIFVQHSLYEKVAAKVMLWKKEGKLPESLRIESFGETVDQPEAIEGQKGGWVIAANGDLIYLPEIPANVNKIDTSIDGKIRRRAAELARTVE